MQQRYLPPDTTWLRLHTARFPELTNPRAQHARLAAGALVALILLVAMHVPIRPGRAMTAREWQRSPALWGWFVPFMLLALHQLVQSRRPERAEPLAIAIERASHQLAAHLWLTLPAALLGAVLLYRNLQQRFEQMEAPLRSKTMDRWFAEI